MIKNSFSGSNGGIISASTTSEINLQIINKVSFTTSSAAANGGAFYFNSPKLTFGIS